ncbi:hypothetical protein [Bosea sp. (in: a-proteobacteria)]|uniref:hypothetical protein n=1 Tax=Bosea sp. (in: a-proteobacteria) TaxID=1871050 RepID=UPI002FC6B65D
MRELLFGLIAGPLMAVLILFLAGQPVEGRPVVAVFPPGSGEARMIGAIAASGGAVLALSAGRPVAVSVAEAAGYAGRLYAAGAWLVLDARLAKLCMDVRAVSGSSR